MAGSEQTFTPAYQTGIANTTSTTTSNSKIDDKKRHSVLLTNTGTELVFVRCGDISVVATAADYPLLGGSQVKISKDAEHGYVAMLASSGTPIVYAMSGSGL